MKPIFICFVLIYLAKGSTVTKQSVQINIKDDTNLPLVITISDRSPDQNPRKETPMNIPTPPLEHMSDHNSEIKYKHRLLQNRRYSTMLSKNDISLLKLKTGPFEYGNNTKKMKHWQAKKWSTKWGSTNSASNGARNSNNKGHTGSAGSKNGDAYWSWSTSGSENNGVIHSVAASGGKAGKWRGGHWSTSGNLGNSGGSSAGNIASNWGGSVGVSSSVGSTGHNAGTSTVAGNNWSYAATTGRQGSYGQTGGGNVGTEGGGGHTWGGAGGSSVGGSTNANSNSGGAGGSYLGGAVGGATSLGGRAGSSSHHWGVGRQSGVNMGLNLGRTGNGGYLAANGKFVFSQGFREYQTDVLQMHNKYRKIHNAKALTLDMKLSKGAMVYARTMAHSFKKIRHSGSFKNIKVGENLLISAVPITGATVVKTWYDQVYNYDFTTHRGRNEAPYSAFVQVVWKKSRRIGAGRAVGKVKGQMFVFYCVRYEPTGYVGSVKNFKKNVDRGKFGMRVAGGHLGTAGESVGSAAMEDLETFVMSSLNTHNMLRSLHGVPPLRLDQNLCQEAFRKSSGEEKADIVRSEAGMNIFDICQGSMSGAAVTKEWYKDACYYDFEKQDSSRETKSQFRQMIWKDSENFGISYKVYRNENKICVRITALYTPVMEGANTNLMDQVKKGKFLGCENGMFTYAGGIVISQCS